MTVSVTVAMVGAWWVPGVDLYAHDWFMRLRGPLALPTDIAIVAIDEPSIARYGRFPWPRKWIAQAIDAISQMHPKAIAVDILFTDPTSEAGDGALENAVARAGKVVLAAQLVHGGPEHKGRTVWLRPLPALERAAAATGHVNVPVGLEGVARTLLLRQADNFGDALWAMAVETVRIGDRLPETAIRDEAGAVVIGDRRIPVERDDTPLAISSEGLASRFQTVRTDAMMIDYVGPAGSFSKQTYSIADLIDDRVPPDTLSGKYILIGVTAAAMGDRIASPFVHLHGGGQQGALMPGVEVLANELNTILSRRFYSTLPDGGNIIVLVLVALAALAALWLIQGRCEWLGHVLVLGGLASAILAVAYLSFTRLLLIVPVVPVLASFSIAVPLELLRRSLAASAGLDVLIEELRRSDGKAALGGAGHPNPAEWIARLTGAVGVALFRRSRHGHYGLVAEHGAPVRASLRKRAPQSLARQFPGLGQPGLEKARAGPASRYFLLPPQNGEYSSQVTGVAFGAGPTGFLLLACPASREPDVDVLYISAEIAAGFLPTGVAGQPAGSKAVATRYRWGLPRGIEWKASALTFLSRQRFAQARFVDLALRSVEDGLLVAGLDDRIVFANRRAEAILGVPEHALVGRDLLERLGEEKSPSSRESGIRELLMRLVVEREPVEREIVIDNGPARFYTLRLSVVTAGNARSGHVLGLVASLSDITKQRELEQTKNDVMALVSHEMRTPLTAIQGMSELLSQYDVEPERRRTMHLAINEEVKRLARMIEEYLDLARIESGLRRLRLNPVRLDSLVSRVLLLLEPLAAQRGIRILRRFPVRLQPLVADADLLARAVTNLVSNSIKYSPANSEVEVSLGTAHGTAWVEVLDYGCGIPQKDLDRIFEKFYRVLRVEDAEVVGSGLGLSLVREVAELHGGKVTVRSTEGKGSVFRLEVPLERDDNSLQDA